MNETDDILDTIGRAIADGYFEDVENTTGAVYITHKGKTYALSVMECEG
jgi:hypothetical protein